MNTACLSQRKTPGEEMHCATAEKNLRILHVLDHSVPLHSGYTFRSQSILREQQRMGFHPIAVTSPKHEQSWKASSELTEELDGFRFYRSGPIELRAAVVHELAVMNRLYRRIREVANLERPDILHAHSPILNAMPALRAGRKLGIPVVYEIRAFWEDAAVDHGTHTEASWRYKATRCAETWVCRRAAQVGVICTGLKEDLVGRGILESKITVIPNGVDPAEFSAARPDPEFRKTWNLDGKRVIGFLGSFYRYEGLEVLVRAFAELARSRENVGLLLAGGGEVEQELVQQIRGLGIQNRVILPGRIPHDRIPGVYALCDVLAYPRNSARITELVTPLKPLEAMAGGKAVVASAVGGHRELIQHGTTGLLFPPGNTEALANQIVTLLEDNALKRRIEENARAWVHSERSWRKATSVYEQIYGAALASRTEPAL